MESPLEIHVISNTHWDREWLFDFRETRAMLVAFFDRLLAILDERPDYRSYLLDGQTVPLEDYLEVRPEQRQALARQVAAGRLLVGPWYTCPEEFCVNGESLVRNLLYGHRVAREFGQVMKEGYTPFSYGQISQMPQIYQGFGIDTILFYHGVSHDDTPNEFLFEGADGSRLFASQMSTGARYNFYHHVCRRVLYGSRIDDREYDWAQGGLPFHRCGEGRCMEHHVLLEPVAGFHTEYLEEAVRALRDREAEVATTPYVAFMDGHDSSVPDVATLRIIDEARRILGGDVIFHSTLPAWIEKTKAAARDVPVLRGERRVPKPMGARVHLYSDVLSCRTRMKRANAQAEWLLQRMAEPFAAVAWLLGAEYPASSLDAAWKLLLRSHAHDSIAGTGVDDIERDMMHRLRQVTNIAQSIVSRSLQHIQRQIDNSGAGPDAVLLTVFNPSPFPRSEVISVVLDLPRTCGYGSFSLRDPARDQPVPAQVVSRRPFHAVVNHAGDATAMMACDRVRLHMQADAIPPLGYATFCLEHAPLETGPGLVSGLNAMENEHLAVRIETDGTLTIHHKDTGAVFEGLHYFEDSGEAGHAWMHIEPAYDSTVSTAGGAARIALLENGPLLARYQVECILHVPLRLEENGGDAWQRLDGGPNASRRSRETRPMTLVSEVTLRKGSRAVEVTTRFDNTCHDHRLRVMFPTRLAADTCSVESAFDVVEREVLHEPGSPWASAVNPTFPMQRFVDVSDGDTGLAIINDGLREYEVTRDAGRSIAVTLLRAFEVALTTVSKRWERHPEMGLSQAPGEHEFRYWILPHGDRWEEGDVCAEAERLALPLEPVQVGGHAGRLPRRHSFASLEPGGRLLLSALKRSEDGAALVARVYNPGAGPVEGTLRLFQNIEQAEAVSLEETPQGALPVSGESIELQTGAHKIVTVRLTPGG